MSVFKEKRLKRQNCPESGLSGRPATFSGRPAISFSKTGRWPPSPNKDGRWCSPHAPQGPCKFWGGLESPGPEKVQEKCTFCCEIAPPKPQLQLPMRVSSLLIESEIYPFEHVVTSPGGEPEAAIESPSLKRAFPCSLFWDKHTSWFMLVLHYHTHNLHSHAHNLHPHAHTCIVMHVSLISPKPPCLNSCCHARFFPHCDALFH